MPDEMELPYEPKSTAKEISLNYDFHHARMSRALNHSTVKLSWDQNDPKRLSKLQANYQAMKKRKGDDDLSAEEDAYKGLVAGSSSEDDSEELDENEERNQERIDEMRKKLLGGLTEDNNRHRKSAQQNGSDDESDREELDVNFGIGFGEDIGAKLVQ